MQLNGGGVGVHIALCNMLTLEGLPIQIRHQTAGQPDVDNSGPNVAASTQAHYMAEEQTRCNAHTHIQTEISIKTSGKKAQHRISEDQRKHSKPPTMLLRPNCGPCQTSKPGFVFTLHSVKPTKPYAQCHIVITTALWWQ